MKNPAILLLFLLLSSTSCKKDNTAGCSKTDPFSPDNAIVISKGDLTFSSIAKLTGVATIYQQKNGKYVLGIEQITISSATDLSVYFSPTASLPANAMKLFSFKNIAGKLYYELPATINISSAKFLLIANDISPDPSGIAELK